MSKINLTLPDGKSKSYNKGIIGIEVAKSIGPRLAQDALAIEVNGKLMDLSAKIDYNAKIKIITYNDKEGVELFRHSTAHILAHAVTDLFPKALPTIGPAVEEGFYYDFDIDHHFTPEDVKKIEKIGGIFNIIAVFFHSLIKGIPLIAPKSIGKTVSFLTIIVFYPFYIVAQLMSLLDFLDRSDRWPTYYFTIATKK